MKPPDETRDLLLVFGTVQRVMRAERAARDAGADVDVIPAPRSVSSECGVVLEGRVREARVLAEALEAIQLEPSASYLRRDGSWGLAELSRLAAPGTQDEASGTRVALTQGSAYGGCGAKLAKGTLATLLCGLPRVESEDLLVGIEFADDAGVVRLTDELALIQTVDFFPPIVDDPYSYGRIAAVNALSDVYAMGGRPIAGMNLVSFPAAQHDKATLQEILRGGLSALNESGAVLAGGHTVEGQELLYGLAVSGTVHPDRIWKNDGARPGDVLVLTKPLGTGVITTGAKAELVDPESLTTAIRWMSTSNRRAAETAAELAPHAVTDVTGFALCGHAAELAEASGLVVEIELERLPLLPGALDAAAMGLVPAGAGKNRDSLQQVLAVSAGADPVRVDLALDPQTSGGLLIACAEEAARLLVSRLPEAAIVGRCVAGDPGHIKVR
jgi:selenide,water dikinase